MLCEENWCCGNLAEVMLAVIFEIDIVKVKRVSKIHVKSDKKLNFVRNKLKLDEFSQKVMFFRVK